MSSTSTQFFSIVISNLTLACEICFLKKYIKNGDNKKKKKKTLEDM